MESLLHERMPSHYARSAINGRDFRIQCYQRRREPVTASKDTLNEKMLRAALFPLALVALHQLLLFAVRKEYTVHESGGIVVTGASQGIGRHAALALAKKGYVVYAGCRKVHATACQA